MMPTEVLIVGLFDVVSKQPPESLDELWAWVRNPLALLTRPTEYGLGWANTYWAIIVPFLASATGTFLFRQHFMSIPRSLADAAKIDGAGPFRFLTGILIPMSWNTIGALAVIQFVYVWDQYLWPLVIIRRTNKQVIQVGLNLIISTGEGTQWGYVMAGALLALLAAFGRVHHFAGAVYARDLPCHKRSRVTGKIGCCGRSRERERRAHLYLGFQKFCDGLEQPPQTQWLTQITVKTRGQKRRLVPRHRPRRDRDDGRA